MDFNFEDVYKGMIDTLAGNLKDGTDQIINLGKESLEQSKENMNMLSSLLLAGEITKNQFDLRINDVKMTIENQILAEEVIAKSTAQKAINSAMDVLTAAISKFLLNK